MKSSVQEPIQKKHEYRFGIKDELFWITSISASLAVTTLLSSFPNDLGFFRILTNSLPNSVVMRFMDAAPLVMFAVPFTFLVHLILTLNRKIRLVSNDFLAVHVAISFGLTIVIVFLPTSAIRIDNFVQGFVITMWLLLIWVYVESFVRRKERNQLLPTLLVATECLSLTMLGIIIQVASTA